jgi:hypothetical protein
MLNIFRTATPPPRIYKVADTLVARHRPTALDADTSDYISVDNNGIQRSWTTLDGTATIRQIVEGPWISNDEIYQDFPADEIAAFDTWIRERCVGPGRPEWEDHLRPQMDRPQREPFILLTLFEIPTAPSAEHQQQPLPPHVSALLITHAVSTCATCPITMEPIQAATATTTPCGHVFNRDALNHWTSRQSRHTCPECRALL